MPTNLTALAWQFTNPTPRIPDGECLRRFVEYRDEEAFAELINRNGPLVLRACRSILHDSATIDDAFQTTFLQLVRHATSLTATPSLAGWLHKTAVRAAGAIRRAEGRRREREQVAQSITNTHSQKDLSWLEIRELIDVELARLPEKYRLPLLLCYIEGLTYDDTAARLGCSLGALRGRLERGRQLLRCRLEARGLPLVALTLGTCTPAAVSAGLRVRTLAVVGSLGTRPSVLVSWNAFTLHSKVFIAGCLAALVAVGVGLGTSNHSIDSPIRTSPEVPAVLPVVTTKASDALLDAFGDPLPRGAVARLGTQRFMKYSRTRDFSLSPDGKTIAVGDKSFTLLDAVTGQVIQHQASVHVGGDYTLPGLEGEFTTPGIFWRPDGHGVALIGRYSWDKYLWDFTDPKDIPPTFEPRPNDVLPPEPPEGAISCAAVSADGKWIAIARQPSDPNRRVVQVYACKTGKHISDLKADRMLGPFSTASERIWFAADGRELILARADHTVIAIDAFNGKELRQATLPKWSVIATSPDGKFVAIVPRHPERDVWHTGDETVRVFDMTMGKEIWKYPRPGDSISGLAFTPDSKHLITSDMEYDFRKWDLVTGKEAAIRQPWNGCDSMSVVAISADGKRYATARTSTSIKVWDAGTGTHVNPLTTHRDAVAGMAVSPDSHLVATVGYDGTLRVWQTTSGKQVCTSPAPRVYPRGIEYGSRRAVTFTPDGRGVIFDAAGVLTMADPTTGKPLDLPGGLKGLPGTVGEFSVDGKTLVTFSRDTTTFWDWPTGTSRQTFRVSLEKPRLWGPQPKDPLVPVIKNVALSPDGSTLLTISNQQTDPIDGWGGPNSNDCWDVKTGKRRFQFAPDLWYPQMLFSPDGRTFYTGGQPSDPEGHHHRLRRDGLASWDVATRTIIRRFDDPLFDPNPGPHNFGRHVNALALSSDGRLLAVSEDHSGTIWIHETASGRVVHRFDGHNNSIYSLSFSPDASKLISVSFDHTGLVWDITLPAFTDRKAGPLTPKELADSWDRLAAPDPVLAWRAVADLTGSPAEAVAFLADCLKPLPVPTAAELDRIEKQLDAPEFNAREKASAELDAYGPNAVASVKVRINTTSSSEVKQRLNEFLKHHAGERVSPLVLRGTRGIAVLEAIGTPDARKILARLAGNNPSDHLGVDAAAALARLVKRDGRK